jgi:hypothetical protein
MYANSAKNSKNLDVITTVNFSWLSEMTRVTTDLLSFVTKRANDTHAPMSYDQALSALNAGRSWDVIYGVHGLSDNPRPVMYEALYRAVIANKATQEPTCEGLRVSGAHCETDMLIPEIALAPPEAGDILAVFGTGAYNYAMASNYNRFTRPAMVLVRDGKAELIVKREALDDLLRQDVLPERLS